MGVAIYSVMKRDAIKISSHAGGLLPLVLLLSIILTPLHPLEVVTLAIASIYVGARLGNIPTLYIITIAYAVLSFINIHIGLYLLAIATALLLIHSRKYSLALGVAILTAIAYLTLNSSTSPTEYYIALIDYLAGESHEILGLHLAITPTLIVYILMNTPYLRTTPIARYIIENPGAYPIIQFIILLVYAAALLTAGYEFIANKLAEIAYYNLVIGVALMIKQVLREGREDREA